MPTTSEYRTDHPPRTHVRHSLTDLVKQVRDEVTVLFRQEVALAKAEVGEKLSRVSRNAIIIAVGGLVAYAGVMFLLLAATAAVYVLLALAGLGPAVNLWLSPLLVGLLVVGISGAFMMKAIKKLSHESAVPERTAESLREDKQWLTHRVR